MDRDYSPTYWFRIMRASQLLALYNWHGQHHVAHITSLRQRMGW